MANVRLDTNGLPKGFVYEPSTPVAHRSSVTSVDASDPEDTSGAVDCTGYKECRFDIDLSGTGFQSLDVQVIFYNSRLTQWHGGASRQLVTTGNHALVVDARGGVIFLKVTTFSGTSFSLDADYLLS